MYDLKVNCAFMPHKGNAKKPTVGNFGVKCSACIARELHAMAPGTVQADIK